MSSNGVQERHQDYVWTFPTLQPGQLLVTRFRFDPDAPFELRGLAARIPYVVGQGPFPVPTQAGLQFVSVRFSGPTEDYRQQARVPVGLLMGAYFGQYGNPRPVSPGVFYPANAVTVIDIQNDGPAPLAGVQVFFRGVKLGRPGQWPAYTYPAKMKTIPYAYPILVPQLAVTTNDRLNQVFRVKPNGDFVLRAGQAGRSFVPPTYEVFLTLRDQAGVPYSNAPVHVDVLFGQSVGNAAYPVGPTPIFVPPIGPGASAPGLLYPEIYLPSDHLMLYDIHRDDSAYGGAVVADFPINLIGSKVVRA